jgi:hypothetical protein
VCTKYRNMGVLSVFTRPGLRQRDLNWIWALAGRRAASKGIKWRREGHDIVAHGQKLKRRKCQTSQVAVYDGGLTRLNEGVGESLATLAGPLPESSRLTSAHCTNPLRRKSARWKPTAEPHSATAATLSSRVVGDFSILGINYRLRKADHMIFWCLMHKRASAWTPPPGLITLRLPHPFGVYCTCTPVESALSLFQGNSLGPRLV